MNPRLGEISIEGIQPRNNNVPLIEHAVFFISIYDFVVPVHEFEKREVVIKELSDTGFTRIGTIWNELFYYS